MDWDDIEFEDDDFADDEFEDDEDNDGQAVAGEVDNTESFGGKLDGDIDDGRNDVHADVDSDASYICDNCGEEIVIPIDMAGGQQQSYVEDCPVCCCPSLIHVYVDADHVDVRAEPEQDRY
jgi:hypothetical protein